MSDSNIWQDVRALALSTRDGAEVDAADRWAIDRVRDILSDQIAAVASCHRSFQTVGDRAETARWGALERRLRKLSELFDQSVLPAATTIDRRPAHRQIGTELS